MRAESTASPITRPSASRVATTSSPVVAIPNSRLASEPIDMDRFYRSIHRTIKDLIHAPNLYVALHDRDAPEAAGYSA